MDYYRICFKDEEHLGTGRMVDDRPLFFPPYEGEIIDWQELVLGLVDGDYPDYLASDFGGRICSERMRAILDDAATSDDVLQWLSVKVKSSNEKRQYYYLHFPAPPAVLHPKKTIFAVGNVVVRPVLSSETAALHAVFSYPKNEGTPLIVNELVRKEIFKIGLTGLELNKMPIA